MLYDYIELSCSCYQIHSAMTIKETLVELMTLFWIIYICMIISFHLMHLDKFSRLGG
jgi:hypothetical protein